MKVLLLLIFILFPFTSNAFQIDSMIKVANSNNENHLIVTGNSSSREFIYVTLSELISKDNKTKEITYNADNASKWPIVAEPAEIVVSNGEEVKVSIVKKYKESSNDRIFGITFTPDTINKNTNQKYSLPFGYKTWFIVPGTSKLTGQIDVVKDQKPNKYIISNDTNKALDITINLCDTSEKMCRASLLLKPWTKKDITLANSRKNPTFIFHAYENGSKQEVKRISL